MLYYQLYSIYIYYLMQKNKIFIYLLLWLFTCPSLQASWVAAPLRIEGIGNILISAYQWEYSKKQSFLFGGGIASNNQNIVGANSTTKINNATLTGSFFSGSFKTPSTYTRGTQKAPLFFISTRLNGVQFSSSLKKKLSKKNEWNFSYSFVHTTQNFGDIFNKNYKEIPDLTSIHLSKFDSLINRISIQYNYAKQGNDTYQEIGWRFFTKIQGGLQDTNTLYSGTFVTDLESAFYIPFWKFYLIPKVFFSRAQVTSGKTDDKTKLRELFKIQCEDNSAQNLQNCENLGNKLVDNLARHNRYGTATPLGGIAQMRSESILRYKGSQTDYQAIELRYPFQKKKLVMEPVLFWEKGRSFDQDNLEDEKKYITSQGIEYRFHLSQEIVYKILYATSKQNTAWQLAVGSKF